MLSLNDVLFLFICKYLVDIIPFVCQYHNKTLSYRNYWPLLHVKKVASLQIWYVGITRCFFDRFFRSGAITMFCLEECV